MTDESKVFQDIAGMSYARAAAANNPAAPDIRGYFEAPTEETPTGKLDVFVLKYLNANLFKQGQGMGSVSVNGKEYLPYDVKSLADKASLCDQDGLLAHYPSLHTDFSEQQAAVMALADYLPEVAQKAARWEPSVKAYQSDQKELAATKSDAANVATLKKLAILATAMNGYGCQTIKELKSTREFINEAFRNWSPYNTKEKDKSLSDFEAGIWQTISDQNDEKDRELTMKEFCDRAKAAAEKVEASGKGEVSDVVTALVFHNRDLAEVEKSAADPTRPEKEREKEKPEEKGEVAGHGR